MKPEDKYLDYLFDSARKEESQYTFEEASDIFASSSSSSIWAQSKDMLIKNISLNSILIFIAGTFALITFSFFPPSEKIATENFAVTNSLPESSIIEKDHIKLEKENIPALLKVNIPKQEQSNEKKKTNKKLISNNNFSAKKIGKSQKEGFIKIEIPVSPRLTSIAIELKEVTLPFKPFVATKAQEVTPIPSEIQTIEETFNPWVSGPPSEMSWKIRKRSKVPILNESERVLQKCMNTKYLEQIFDKSENGYFKPLNMVTNYSIDENYFVQFREQRVRLISEKLAPDFDPTQPHINIKRFKINKNKAIMVFDYKDYHVIIQLRRVQQGWKRHRLRVKKNKNLIVKKYY